MHSSDKEKSARILYEGKSLPDWHPLVSGKADSVKNAGIQIQNGVHEEDIDEENWEDYEL